jgi:hypothetical protein
MRGCQELERRAHDKYDAFDRVNAEAQRFREQCNAFDALADALRTPDSWLAYRALAWPDELPESSRQDTTRRSSLERVRAALLDRDEALWNARADLEKTQTLAANWEAEVATARAETGSSARRSRGRRRSNTRLRSGRAGWSSAPRRPTT